MSTDQERHYQVGLPDRPRRLGPVTRRKLTRSLLVWLALWLCGVLTVAADSPLRLTAFALGLAMPGGGLLHTGHWLLFALGATIFVFSVFIWWALGPVVLPVAVWLGLALLPNALDTGHECVGTTLPGAVVLGVTPVLLVAAALAQEFRFRGQVRRGRELAPRLARERFTISASPAVPAVAESTPEDLAALRYALDLALQPLDRFDGFTRIDQFREAALRYQLNSLGYALATAQYNRTPAFTGYLVEAQRNAIDKMLDKRIWRYWAWENLWGNLRWNPDPADRENIMLTGFLGVQVGMYESLNDNRYSTPGALTFEWNSKRRYRHDFTSLAESVHRNMIGSAYGLYPCEPNWIYTVCNTFGLNTLLLHDRLHGSELAADVIDRLRHAYDTDFLRPDGRIVGVRCERLGLSWNLWAGPAIQLTTALWLNPGMPDRARRTWWIVRDQEIHDAGDRVSLAATLSNRLDPGNYQLGNDAYGLMMVEMAAREMGDTDTAARALAGLRDSGKPETVDGVTRYAGLSTLGNLYALQSRFNRADGIRDLIGHGAPTAWRTGPILAEAAYPDVLVARAVTDGHALDLTLYPGARACRTTLLIERLVPHRTYTVRGASIDLLIASATGTATLTIDLGARHEIRISPR